MKLLYSPMKCRLVSLFLLLLLAQPAHAAPESLQKRVQGLLSRQQGKAVIALQVQDLRSGEVLAAQDATVPLKPASVMKILTSAAALETLGADYRFGTEIRYDEFKRNKVSTLYIHGGADPSLTLESLWLLTRKLYKRGIRTIETVVIDNSSFSAPRARVGQRAYETGSSPLALSFNSLALDVCPGNVGTGASVTPDPWEADVSVRGSIKTIERGAGQFAIDEQQSRSSHLDYLVSGTIGVGRDCETVYRSVGDPVHFFGSVFVKMAASLGMNVMRAPRAAAMPGSAPLMFVHFSKPLSLVLEDMNHFSTNFIAEQIIYALGEENRYFDRERGLERLRAVARKAGYADGDFTIVDGSGLSHHNRLSAALITEVLRQTALDPDFGVEFQKSLSVAGRNGTLKERRFDRGIVVRGKTGTLDGVSTLAGLVQTKSGRDLAFSVIQNNVASKDRAVQFENALISELYQTR